MAPISLNNLTKIYDDATCAVRSLSLDVADGEFLVFVGPSGCGKTTALRMVAGLEEVTEGTISIDGTVVNQVSPKARDIAMIFQSYALYPHMSVFDNMAFALKLRSMAKPDIATRVHDAARVLGLFESLTKKPSTLSGGQRQRVAMGRAIVRQPKAFLMDEPLSNLDAKLRVEMRAELTRLQRDLSVTTIYVTHDQTEAMTMADRVAVMRGGVLQQLDTPEGLYTRPVNLFVAAFIGSPAMNLVGASLVWTDDGVFADFGGQRLRVDSSVLAARPALRKYASRPVVIGIRPEDMDDASVVPAPDAMSTISAVTQLRENVGAEAYLHITLDAPPIDVVEVTDERARVDRGVSFVARADRATRARDGEPVTLAVRTDCLHFFDPATGSSIFDD